MCARGRKEGKKEKGEERRPSLPLILHSCSPSTRKGKLEKGEKKKGKKEEGGFSSFAYSFHLSDRYWRKEKGGKRGKGEGATICPTLVSAPPMEESRVGGGEGRGEDVSPYPPLHVPTWKGLRKRGKERKGG